MKVLSVIGTRPNFIKEFLMYHEFQRQDITEILVHTGQHYDYTMSQAFFKGFQLPEPQYHLDQRGKTNIQQTASILQAMEEILRAERPTCTLVYGDVNSTTAAALASAKLRIPVVHVEGGVRSQDLYNPEEINRRVTDHLSALVFACTKTDYDNLVKENFGAERICLSGDLMKDAIVHTIAERKISITREDYVVVTIHREENVESKERLEGIVRGLIESRQHIIFPIHPRTYANLERFGLLKDLEHTSRIQLMEPQGYVEFVRLLAKANRVFTDSGGVRREAYILGKPVIVPIHIVWFPEILEHGWMVTINPEPDEITQYLTDFEPDGERPEIFGDGLAHRRIVNRMVEYFQA